MLQPGDTYILLKDVEGGANLNTVYSTVELAYDESHVWMMEVDRVMNKNLVQNANITYKVTFDTDGGSTVSTQEVLYGEKATRPSDPTKQGEEFGGWYTTSAFTTEFDFDTIIANDTTVYAKWSAPVQRYTITIYNEDAEGSCVVTATPLSGQAEVYTVPTGSSQVLAKGIVPGEAVSSEYSSIVADFNGVTVTVDTTTVITQNTTFNVAIPHPALTTTIRITNEAQSAVLIYTATPADSSPAETGFILAGNSANLSLGVREGYSISSVYSSIAVSYPNTTIPTIYADTTLVAGPDTYLDLTYDDITANPDLFALPAELNRCPFNWHDLGQDETSVAFEMCSVIDDATNVSKLLAIYNESSGSSLTRKFTITQGSYTWEFNEALASEDDLVLSNQDTFMSITLKMNYATGTADDVIYVQYAELGEHSLVSEEDQTESLTKAVVYMPANDASSASLLGDYIPGNIGTTTDVCLAQNENPKALYFNCNVTVSSTQSGGTTTGTLTISQGQQGDPDYSEIQYVVEDDGSHNWTLVSFNQTGFDDIVEE